jgi:FAD/FMN-containing dehydrogenase
MVIQERRSSRPVLGKATLQDFESSLRGKLLTPGDTDRYDEARTIFNAMIDRRPALIVRVADTRDIALSVGFARSNGLPLAIKSGGHGVAGHAVCDDGLVIDLSCMKRIAVDPERRVARAQAGLRLGELITELERHGFVTPTGTVSDTGVGGLTLGGGYGWLNGKYGMAVDNVVGAEIVTADGRVLRVSETQHPDLFWAIRGGSGNFGVVSEFEFRLHPAAPLLGGMLIHPFPHAREVLRFYRDFAAAAPDELTTYAAIVTTPDGQQVVALIACYRGDLAEGERALAPLRNFGPPVADLIQPMPYSAMNTLIDAANPPGLFNYWKHHPLRELPDDAIDTIIDYAARVPSPRTAILIEQLHGVAARVSPTDMAFSHRNAPHSLVMISMWEDEAESECNITWTRELASATERFATGGVYVNAVNDGEDRGRAAFGVNYDRLAQIKRQYDPTNLFRHNQNIRPAG